MKNPFRQSGLLIVLVIFLAGCYPGGAEYTSDTDIVITNYNDQYDFASIQTYYLADSIQHVVEEGTEPDRSLDSYIISELERNFDKLGWQRLDTVAINNGQNPDVAVVGTVTKVTTYNIWTGTPWYPGWGWGWYYKDTNYWGYPGYGWGYYPWYPTYVTSYETGTLVWRMFDPDNINEDQEILYVEWLAGLNGILGSSTSSTKDRISKGIRQAFDQSPYLSE
jgi:hypothetical protein